MKYILNDTLKQRQSQYQTGGNGPDMSNKAHGGFPPIYTCSEELLKKRKDMKKREYASPIKSKLNLKSIMKGTMN